MILNTKMIVEVLGGPFDGAKSDIGKEVMGEGQKFMIEDSEYFYHVFENGIPKLIYYMSSREG